LFLGLTYAIAAIPFGLVLAKIFAKKDIREFGSKNIGATNVARVIGKKLIHYDDDASIDILTPRMRLFQINKAPVTVKADTGHLDGDLTIMDLYDNAQIFRPAQEATETQAASPRMLAASSYFKLLINDDIIETDKPMTLEQGMSIMNSAAGGTFNNVDQSMRLSGRVKGRIERAPKESQ
jgi:lipopolysaccharide export system protein LptC